MNPTNTIASPHPAGLPPHVSAFADPRSMQDRLFAALSEAFAKEVPLYGGSLRVNLVCNVAACDLLSRAYEGFSMTEADIERTSGERHGAIRIGTPEEYAWVARWFAAFGMEPHNFYDMSRVGAKSQPVVATAYRSKHRPEHRVFCSLLLTEYFDDQTRARIESLLSQRRVFTDRARMLIEKGERQGGLSWDDAEALITEGVERIFRWTGTARDFGLYTHLCDAGFKIAADIACFEAHHLNHLTPNTFCMDLYTAAMELCLSEINEPAFRERATRAMRQLLDMADRDYMRLHFKHLSADAVAAFARRTPSERELDAEIERLVQTLRAPEFDLHELDHAGFKDYTEGPDAGTPVFLRQDAYKALSEPVRVVNPDGSVVDMTHTARFGEIEQRFFAATPTGRALYNRCADAAEAARGVSIPDPAKDHAGALSAYAKFFDPFPKNLHGLLRAGLAYGEYEATPAGIAARGALPTRDLLELVRLGFVAVEGIRYEDFLPVSAAGIFASNLDQYGTRATAPNPPVFTRQRLEAIIGRPIIEADEEYARRERESIERVSAALGVAVAVSR
ncbi:MAG: VOC family protein [Leptolyngbya sp. PLA1]|nr:VOC family protein [Leptolyngbya sp. PLA1]